MSLFEAAKELDDRARRDNIELAKNYIINAKKMKRASTAFNSKWRGYVEAAALSLIGPLLNTMAMVTS